MSSTPTGSKAVVIDNLIDLTKYEQDDTPFYGPRSAFSTSTSMQGVVLQGEKVYAEYNDGDGDGEEKIDEPRTITLQSRLVLNPLTVVKPRARTPLSSLMKFFIQDEAGVVSETVNENRDSVDDIIRIDKEQDIRRSSTPVLIEITPSLETEYDMIPMKAFRERSPEPIYTTESLETEYQQKRGMALSPEPIFASPSLEIEYKANPKDKAFSEIISVDLPSPTKPTESLVDTDSESIQTSSSMYRRALQARRAKRKQAWSTPKEDKLEINETEEQDFTPIRAELPTN
jgi:hypothetical protein